MVQLSSNSGEYREPAEDHDVPGKCWYLHSIWGVSAEELSQGSEVTLSLDNSSCSFLMRPPRNRIQLQRRHTFVLVPFG